MDCSTGGDVISCGRGLWVMRSSARVVHIPHKFEHPIMFPVVGIVRRYKIGVALSCTVPIPSLMEILPAVPTYW
jgi:hypothetical protein